MAQMDWCAAKQAIHQPGYGEVTTALSDETKRKQMEAAIERTDGLQSSRVFANVRSGA